MLGLAWLTGCTQGEARQADGGVYDLQPVDPAAIPPPLTSRFVLHGEQRGRVQGNARVRVGIPRADTGNGFVELTQDGDIVLDTFGQGGFHAELAVACVGFGNFAYPRFHLENLDAEGEVWSPAFSAAQPLSCDDDGVCVRSPNYILLGGLVDDPDDLDGLHIRVTVTVRNDDDLMGEASQTGYLRAAF